MALKNKKANYPFYEITDFTDFRDLTEQSARRYGDKPAITYKTSPHDKELQHYSYVEARDVCRALGTEWHAAGMSGKTVAIIGESSPEWILCYFSLMASGAITVPVDKELPAADMASILNSAECTFALYSPTIEKKFAEVCTLVPTLQTCIAFRDNAAGNMTVEDVRRRGEERMKNGDTTYFDFVQHPEQLATIVFTSGTTGKGKGVMLSASNIISDMTMGMYNFKITERTIAVLPPHHTFCSTVVFVGHYALGCELYISSGIKYILKEMEEFRPQHLVLVPLFIETFYKRIMTTAEKSGKLRMLKIMIGISNFLRKLGIDLRDRLFTSVTKAFGGEVSMIISGGAALNQDIIDFFESIGIAILNGYGITECAPLISCNRNEYRKTSSVGIPIRTGHVKILPDPDAAEGTEEGEIAYRGPNVMLGYFRNEEATKEVMTEDGYFRTGDYGRVETEGDDQWVYITGRKKNLIIFSNGKNVYPEEIETDIQGIYGVGEVVVYAGQSISDPKKEVIVAEIYPDTDALALHGITDAQAYFDAEVQKVNQKNVSYKTVGKVKLRDTEFPKNTSRKITRFAIDKTID